MEIDAGPGSISKLLTAVSNCRVTALDIDAESIKKLAPYCERAYQANLNNAAWPEILEKEKKFEVLVAADMLEHVYEPLVAPNIGRMLPGSPKKMAGSLLLCLE